MDEMTPEQQIVHKFKKVKRQFWRVSIPVWVALIGIMILFNSPYKSEFEDSAFVLILPLAALAGVFYIFKIWRCPSCDKYLGKNINPTFCNKCGVKLK